MPMLSAQFDRRKTGLLQLGDDRLKVPVLQNVIGDRAELEHIGYSSSRGLHVRMKRFATLRLVTVIGFLFVFPALAFDVATTRLEPHTAREFDQYVKRREAEMQARPTFLWCDGQPNCLHTVQQNTILVEPRSHRDAHEVRGGLVHDWQGITFVPGAKLDDTLALLRNYDNHKRLYAPEVIDSKVLSRDGDHSRVYLRLRKKKIITVILNTEYDTVFERIDATHGRSKSVSTRITEVESPDTKHEHELPPGADHGFMWRLNSYWRFEERDGGVYIECEAISLSRAVPMMVSGLVAPIVRQLPRESLEKTLLATRRALMK